MILCVKCKNTTEYRSLEGREFTLFLDAPTGSTSEQQYFLINILIVFSKDPDFLCGCILLLLLIISCVSSFDTISCDQQNSCKRISNRHLIFFAKAPSSLQRSMLLPVCIQQYHFQLQRDTKECLPLFFSRGMQNMYKLVSYNAG